MTGSRWKVMAGVLGVSLGGLAAIAGQCPRSDNTKTCRSEDPPAPGEGPKVPPAGPGSKPMMPPAPPINVPPPAPSSALPPLAGAAPAPTDTLKLPEVPSSGSTPAKPSGDLPAFGPPSVPPIGPGVTPPIGPPSVAPPIVPVSGTAPAAPMTPKAQEPAPSVIPTLPRGPADPPSVAPPGLGPVPVGVEFTKPAGPTPPLVVGPAPPTPAPAVSPAPTPPSPAVGPSPAFNPPVGTGAVEVVTPTATQPISTNAPPVTSVATATRFRIILRVGEGEPMFEVRSGDDLVMKVVCEKVDIKSPEKGHTLSAVTASGKVRFVGFGSEGTCDTLAFLAGTGEVSMTGNVKIQVKDKLGRVESELTTDTIKYKIDASALPGALKP